jgi:hypothetical protein
LSSWIEGELGLATAPVSGRLILIFHKVMDTE